MESTDLALLLEKYYNGETTLSEEAGLKKHFSKASGLPATQRPEQVLFKAATTQKEIRFDKYLSDGWLLGKIQVADKIRKQTLRLNSMPVISAAALLILVAGAFFIGVWFNGSNQQQGGELASLKQDLEGLKQVLLTNRSASDRLTILSQDFDPVNDKPVIDLLIATLNQDANVNVRLAACAALYKFRDDDKARKGLVQSLQTQADPMIQIILIEILIGIKDGESLEQLKRLLERKDLLPAVREKAAQGLNILLEA